MEEDNAMFKHVEGNLNEPSLLEPKKPGGQAGENNHDKGHRDELRPRALYSGKDAAKKKEEEECHGANGADQWIQAHDLFGDQNNGLGNGFDRRRDVPEKCRDLFHDDQHADRYQHAFDNRDRKKQRESPGIEDTEDHLYDPDESNGHQQERVARLQISMTQWERTGQQRRRQTGGRPADRDIGATKEGEDKSSDDRRNQTADRRRTGGHRNAE